MKESALSLKHENDFESGEGESNSAMKAEVAGVHCAVPVSQERLAEVCRRWGISKLELFGSVVRDDFDATRSDVDVLVTFQPGALPGWDFFSKLPQELSTVFGRKVDLMQRSAIERSANGIRRQSILRDAVVIYEAG